jgi:hypothetical protein
MCQIKKLATLIKLVSRILINESLHPSHIVILFQVWHLSVKYLFYFENLISTQNFFWGVFDKKIFKLKISTCHSSPIFCANVFLHGTSFDCKSLNIKNMALTTRILSCIENKIYFLELLHTQSQKGKKIKNLLVEHHNSL